jgi:hypothetical protein
VSSRQVVPDDPKVIGGNVGERRAAAAFTHRPDIGRGRLQPLIDTDVATVIQREAGVIEPDQVDVGDAPRRDQEVTPFNPCIRHRRRKHLENLG